MRTSSATAFVLLTLLCSGAASIAGGGLVTLTDSLESAAPGVINGQTTSPLWSDPRITGLTVWRGSTAPSRTAHFTDELVDGDGSRKAAADALLPAAPDSYFLAMRAEFYTHNNPPRRARFLAGPGTPIRTEATLFTGNIAATWTLDPVSMSQGSAMDRLLIGGPCRLEGEFVGKYYQCEDVGTAPGEPTPVFTALGHMACSICPFEWMPLWFVNDAPQGFAMDDFAPIPFGSWVRLIFERDDAAVIRIYVDYLDGQGEFLLREMPAFTPATMVDAVAVHGSFEIANSPVYIDDLAVSGLLDLCDGDANGDGLVDFNDLNITLGQYSTNGPGLGGDFNGDQQVGFADLNILLSRFNTACD